MSQFFGLASESRLIIQEREVKKDRPSDVTNTNMNLFISLLQDDSMLLTDKTLENVFMAEERFLIDSLKSMPCFTSFSKESFMKTTVNSELPPPNISCDDGVYPSENPYRRLTDLQYRPFVIFWEQI